MADSEPFKQVDVCLWNKGNKWERCRELPFHYNSLNVAWWWKLMGGKIVAGVALRLPDKQWLIQSRCWHRGFADRGKGSMCGEDQLKAGHKQLRGYILRLWPTSPLQTTGYFIFYLVRSHAGVLSSHRQNWAIQLQVLSGRMYRLNSSQKLWEDLGCQWFLNDLSSRERVKLKRSLMSWGDRKFQIYEIWIWRSRTKSISDPASQPCEIYYHPKLHRFLKKQYVLPLIYHWMNRQGLLRLQRRPGHLLDHTVRISNKTIIIFRFQLNLI